MKGIVFNLLEEVVTRDFGEQTWDALLDDAGLDGAYTSLGSYPDSDAMRLVAQAATRLGMEPAEVLRWFGRNAIPLLAVKYPAFFRAHTSTRAFLLTLNDIIHPEVRKLYPGAVVPEFQFDTSSPDVLLMGYDSPRRLCALAHGFVEGAADHFGETVVGGQDTCKHRGDDVCLFRLAFEPARATAVT